MRICEIQDRRRLMDGALGTIACDLTITNIRLVNVLTGEIYPAEVDVLDGVVVRIREAGETAALPARQSFHGNGRYLLPGFIDSHMHVESTLMIPQHMAHAIVPWGTTTICSDPHEIANVMGERGIEFMIENSKHAALRQLVLAPSCVPTVPLLESTGAFFEACDVGKILDMPNVIGVAEIMDYLGLVNGAPRVTAIAEEGRKRGMFLQGHAPQVTGGILAAYRIGGPASDHESITAKELREKLRNGLRVNLRAGSIIDKLDELTKGFEGMGWLDQVSICTDDVHAKDLLYNGHVNAILARLIHGGMKPLQAIKLCTLNAAKEYGFDDLGAIAPGYMADMQLVDALDGCRPYAVFIHGKLAALEGRYQPAEEAEACQAPPSNSMQVKGIASAEDFKLFVSKSLTSVRVRVMGKNGQGLCRSGEWMELPLQDGFVSLTEHPELQFISVVNRYGAGNKSIAVTRDFGLKEGALATTVSHDSHNFTVVYRDALSAFACLEKLVQTGGGMCAAQNGKCFEVLPLPVAGLMSFAPCDVLATRIEQMEHAMQSLCNGSFSLFDLSVYSLPAVPGLVLTDLGLVDSSSQVFVPSLDFPLA